MRFTRYIILAFISVGMLPANAQSIKPYLAVIKTSNNNRYQGILQKVDSSKVIIRSDKGPEIIPFQSIKSIKMRVSKKRYIAKDFTPTDEEKTKYKLSSEGKYVDQWGNEEPSLQNEIVGSVVGNVLVNSVGLAIHQINPSISLFRIYGDKASYLKQLDELSYYSIYYQEHPNLSAELDKLKKVSSEFKQD